MKDCPERSRKEGKKAKTYTIWGKCIRVTRRVGLCHHSFAQGLNPGMK